MFNQDKQVRRPDGSLHDSSSFPLRHCRLALSKAPRKLMCHFVTAHPRTGLDISFDAAAVTGPDRDRLWAELDHGVEPQDRK